MAEHQDLGAVERFEHVLAAQPACLVVIGCDVGDGLFRVGAGRIDGNHGHTGLLRGVQRRRDALKVHGHYDQAVDVLLEQVVALGNLLFDIVLGVVFDQLDPIGIADFLHTVVKRNHEGVIFHEGDADLFQLGRFFCDGCAGKHAKQQAQDGNNA